MYMYKYVYFVNSWGNCISEHFQTLGLHVPWQGNPKTVGQLAVGPPGACESALAQPFLKPSRRFLSHFTFVRLRRPQSHKARAFTPVVRDFFQSFLFSGASRCDAPRHLG